MSYPLSGENKKEDFNNLAKKENLRLDELSLNDVRYGMVWSQILDRPRFRKAYYGNREK